MSRVKLAGKQGKGRDGMTRVMEELREGIGRIIELAWFLYMVLMAAWLPFYFEQGYNHIGTDKHTFFRRVSVWAWRALGPVVLLYLAMGIYLWIKETSFGKYHVKEEGAFPAFGKQALLALKEGMSLTDWAALGYGATVLLSFCLSKYREAAFWGAGGWYMGAFSQLGFVAIHFMTSRFVRRPGWLLTILLAVSGQVFLLGYLNRFGIYPIPMESANPSFISTIGNINWYCGYLVSVFFAGVYLLWWGYGKGWMKIALGIYTFVGFGSLVTQGSSSGILALGLVLCALAVLSGREGRKHTEERGNTEAFFKIMTIMSISFSLTGLFRVLFPHAIRYQEGSMDLLTLSGLPFAMTIASLAVWLALKRFPSGEGVVRALLVSLPALVMGALALAASVIAVNTLWPEIFAGIDLFRAPVFTFSPAWGSNRGATWMAGLSCFFHQSPLHMLVGAGPDCMAETLYGEGSPGLIAMVEETFMQSRLTNAHNEWLTVLVNTGLMGLGFYACMMVSAVRRFLKAGASTPLAGACGLCILAYTVNNMVSFQQTMNGVTIYMILGLGEALLRMRGKEPGRLHINKGGRG